jgi:hypothetical protein
MSALEEIADRVRQFSIVQRVKKGWAQDYDIRGYSKSFSIPIPTMASTATMITKIMTAIIAIAIAFRAC